MKTRFYLIPLLFFLFVACSGDDDSSKQETQKELDITVANLEGTWLAKQALRNEDDSSELGSFEPIIEPNQFTYIFKNDLSASDTFIECNGHYELNEENKILQLFFSCIEEDIIWKVNSITNNELILASRVPYGASLIKFTKINN